MGLGKRNCAAYTICVLKICMKGKITITSPTKGIRWAFSPDPTRGMIPLDPHRRKLLDSTRKQTSAVGRKYARLDAGPEAHKLSVTSAKLTEVVCFPQPAISPIGVQGPLAPGAGARGPQRPSPRRSFCCFLPFIKRLLTVFHRQTGTPHRAASSSRQRCAVSPLGGEKPSRGRPNWARLSLPRAW